MLRFGYLSIRSRLVSSRKTAKVDAVPGLLRSSESGRRTGNKGLGVAIAQRGCMSISLPLGDIVTTWYATLHEQPMKYRAQTHVLSS